MRKAIALIFAIALIAAAFFIACEQQRDYPEQAKYLEKGSELAQRLGAFILKRVTSRS